MQATIITLVVLFLAVTKGHSACPDNAKFPFWFNVLYFNRGMHHEALDPFDIDGTVVTVPHTFCHGNHCNYFRQPLEFVCANRMHFDLHRFEGSSLGMVISNKAAAKAQSEAQRLPADFTDPKAEMRRRLKGSKLDASSGEWMPHLGPSEMMAAASLKPLDVLVRVPVEVGSNGTILEREMDHSVRSYVRYTRYNPLDEEELGALVPPTGTSPEERAATESHLRWLAGEFEDWQMAALARFDLTGASSGQKVGHPLHSLRFVAHTSGGTYEQGGNSQLPRLLAKRERQRQLVTEKNHVFEDGSASLPWDLDLSLSDWVCSPRRPSLLEEPYSIENIHIICSATDEVLGSSSDPEDWETLIAGGIRNVWGPEVYANRPAQSIYGQFVSAKQCPLERNSTVPYHCALHYQIVNYGSPKAKAGVIGLVAATVVLVVVMLFFVSGRWYHEKLIKHKTKVLFRDMDREITERRRGTIESLQKDDTLTVPTLPLDVTPVTATGAANVVPVYGGGVADPRIQRALRLDAENQGMRRRKLPTLDHGYNKAERYFSSQLEDPVQIGSRSNSFLGKGSVAGGVFNNPNQYTLGELLGGSGSRFSGLSPSALGADYVSMPLDIGITPKKVPSKPKPSLTPETVQTVDIDDF